MTYYSFNECNDFATTMHTKDQKSYIIYVKIYRRSKSEFLQFLAILSKDFNPIIPLIMHESIRILRHIMLNLYVGIIMILISHKINYLNVPLHEVERVLHCDCARGV